MLNNEMLEEFFQFRSTHTVLGLSDLKMNPLLEHYMHVAKLPTDKLVSKYGNTYLQLDASAIDDLIGWVDETRKVWPRL